MFNANKMMIAVMLGAMVAVSACSTERAVDNTVNATGFVAKTAVKGVVGVGKLGVQGVKKVAGSD